MAKDHLIRIGELAKRTGKTARALHVYEDRGLICPAARSAGGFRLYDADNVERIGYIDDLKTLGCTLDQIADVVRRWSDGPTPREGMAALESMYGDRLTQVRETIAALRRIEGELTRSLGFLAGCHDCAAPGDPVDTCGTCARSTDADDLPLIRGLTGR